MLQQQIIGFPDVFLKHQMFSFGFLVVTFPYEYFGPSGRVIRGIQDGYGMFLHLFGDNGHIRASVIVVGRHLLDNGFTVIHKLRGVLMFPGTK